MKRTIKYLSVIGLLSGLCWIGALCWPPTLVRAAFAEFPLGQPRTINFVGDQETLATLSRREQLDQMRDWLLFTVVSDAGLAATEVNESLFDFPPIRQGYLQATANFANGETRSCLIGKGRVIALVPLGLTPDERADQLAQIADLHRKNLGELPTDLLVFDYQLSLAGAPASELDEPVAEVTFRETLDAREFFTAKHHYIEQRLRSLAEFEQFIGQTDDLVYVHYDGDGLLVGGRKLQGHKHRSIRTEDVAAIWQSEEKIQARGNPLQKKLDAFNERWDNRRYYGDAEKERLEAEYKREEMALQAELKATARKSGFANGSGFSLDPAYDYQGLKRAYDRLLAPYCERYVGAAQVLEVSSALAEKNVDPLFDLLYTVAQQNPILGKGFGEAVLRSFEFQAARYDGELKGTEVGMVLFYTDLLAKLWALDFLDSAPTAAVDDFLPMPAVNVSPIYEKELEELSNTRLWFGPQDKGFQVAEQGHSLLFAHIATRIYAASASSLQPGKESEPNAQSSAFLGWWDSHYAEVSRYEPEYQRLNQIMKWSLLIGWLNQEDHGETLRFLQPVNVKRDNWFPDWAKQHPELRFKAWGATCKPGPNMRNARLAPQVCFFPRGQHKTEAETETEALPRLASRAYTMLGKTHGLSGGVSLAEKSLFKGRVALSTETNVSQLLRRSNLNYGPGTLREGLQTAEGVKFSFKTLSSDRSLLTAVPKEGAKLRGVTSELASSTKIERTVSHHSLGLEIETSANGATLGKLNITRQQNGFRVGWQSREVDRGLNFIRTLRQDGDMGSLLTRDARVAAHIKLAGEEGWAVKLNETDRWFKFAPEKSPTATLENGWHSRVANLDGGKRYKVLWLEENQVPSLIGNNKYLTVSAPEKSGGSLGLEIAEAHPPASAVPHEMRLEGVTVKGLRDANGKLYVKGSDLPPAISRDPSRMRQLFQANELPVNNVADTLRRGDYRQAMRQLLDSQKNFHVQLELNYGNQVKRANRLLSEGNYSQALQELDQLSMVYGARPEITTLRGLAKLGNESPAVSRAINETMQSAHASDTANFFKEVNQRLAQNRLVPADGALTVVSDGRRVALRYDLQVPLQGTSVSPAALHGRPIVVLVQDSPGLNNLNWNLNVERAAQEAVALKLGDLRRVARQDIANLRPSMLYAPETAAVTKTSGQGATMYRPLYRAVLPSSPCPEGEREVGKKCTPVEASQADVYVMVASAKSLNQK